MKFRVDIPVWATAYVEAESKEAAVALALSLDDTEVDVNPYTWRDSVQMSPVGTVSIGLGYTFEKAEQEVAAAMEQDDGAEEQDDH